MVLCQQPRFQKAVLHHHDLSQMVPPHAVLVVLVLFTGQAWSLPARISGQCRADLILKQTEHTRRRMQTVTCTALKVQCGKLPGDVEMPRKFGRN